jgi:copper resistance protein B
MIRLAFALVAATSLTAPALAQHHGHHMPAPKPAPKKPAPKPAAKKAPAKAAAKKPAPAKKAAARPAPRKPAPKKPAAKKPVADPHAGHKAPDKPKADPHAGHGPAKPAVDPHAGHQPQSADPHAGHSPAQPDPHAGHGAAPAQPDPHAGHGAAPQASDPHAGHDMGADPTAPPVASPPPAALSGPAHAADAVFGGGQMAEAREELRAEHGDMQVGKLLVDRLEARIRDGRDGYAWDAQGWYGGDIDKLWVKTEGEGEFGGSVEAAEVQALWSHAIGPFFDLQAGLRYDIRPRPDRSHLVLGVQGLAPYWFEVDAAAFLSNKGDLTARVEAEYDQRITQQLILQPRLEFDLAAQDSPELGIGSGLSTAELGVRLRYEIEPQFAPYIGFEYERTFGDTRRFRRAAGEASGGWSFLLGLRGWF